jgi:coniferyl-aldehyde dehydrogenase
LERTSGTPIVRLKTTMATTAPSATVTLESAFAELKKGYSANPYPDLRTRRRHLKDLRTGLLRRQEDFARAIDQDFGGRALTEVLYSEVFVSVHTIRNAESSVGRWMERRPVEVDLPLQFASAWLMPQPVGVVGVIAPWNYPIFLSMGPLAGALAAGNRVLLKPSELTPATSALLAEFIAETFEPDHVSVGQGGPDTGIAFSRLPFDHLLFTGSTAIGRKVMQAAAENLTPVTLELGGKSPALIAPDANLKRAADDIVYGKLLNAGQTCVAPDYVLIRRSDRDRFVDLLRSAVEKRYPSAVANPDYTSIINDQQFARLTSYLQEAESSGVSVVPLSAGETDGKARRLAPCAVLDPPDTLRLMQDEIFGPILPIRSYDSLDQAVAYINGRPRPLALYLFSGSDRTIEDILKRTVAGGVCVNDTLMHIVAGDLPFGGAGLSGIGQYHGKAGFDTFSKLKPVFRRHGIGIGVMLRPPYGKIHELMRKFLIR